MPQFRLKISQILGLLVVLTTYIATRLYQLTLIPVFVDEAIYIRWSQVMRSEPTLRFLPLSDGKQPLFMWILMPVFKLFSDPLFAGRFVSVLAGLGTLAGVIVLTHYLSKSNRTTLLAALLYIFTPFTFFFDRQALVDSLLSMFGVWSLFIGILIAKKPRFDLAFVLGYLLGGAVLTKSPAWIFLLLQPLLLIIAPKNLSAKLPKLILCWLIAGTSAVLFYNFLRLGPNFELLASRTADYSFPIKEVITHPFNPFQTHIKETFTWLISLLTIPIALVISLSVFIRRKRDLYTVLLWSVLPLLAQAAIAKAYTSRYFLYTIPPLLIATSLAIDTVLTKYKRALYLLPILFLLPLYITYQLYTDPSNSLLPANLKEGHFQEWTAGHGQAEVAKYLINVAQTRSVVAGTDGYFGTLPDGLQMYTQATPHLTVIGVGLPIKTIPESLINSLAENEVYLIINKSRNQLPPSQLERLNLIDSYTKPPRANGTSEVLLFYQLLR